MKLRLLLVIVTAAGCNSGEAGKEPDPSPPVAPAHTAPSAPAIDTHATPTPPVLEIAGSETALSASTFATRFALGDTQELYVRLRFPDGKPVGSSVTLELYGPRGGLVRSQILPIEGGEIVFGLPVAGTDIAKRHVAGTFSLVALLNGSSIATTTIKLTDPLVPEGG